MLWSASGSATCRGCPLDLTCCLSVFLSNEICGSIAAANLVAEVSSRATSCLLAVWRWLIVAAARDSKLIRASREEQLPLEREVFI